MNASLLHSFWQSPWLERVGWTLLHFLWQGTLAATVLAVVLAGLHRASARTRYLVSVLGAAAACLFPLLTFLMLPLPAEPPPRVSLRREVPQPPVSRALLQGASSVDAALPLPATTVTARPPASRQAVQGMAAPGFRQAYRTVAERARPLLPWCAALWAVGVAVLSLRLLAGWTQVQRLRRRGTVPADGRWQARLEGLARRLSIRRAVRLLESTLAEVPAVIGWLRPVVLVPVGVLAGLSTVQVEMILAHELAHIRRQDYLVNLGLTLFETFGFYHPAVWWIARCVRAEREHACDDLAVSACGGDRLGYVRALATLEEMRGPAGQFALAASSGGRGLLLARVRRLLGVTPERRPRTGRATWWLAGAIALLAAFAITLGGVQHPAQAQETPRKQPPAKEQLRGRVVDESGKPVPGALVYDEADNNNMDPGLKEPVPTDADGSFQVPKLRFGGQWRVIAARAGNEAVGWLDIGNGRAPAVVSADNRITQPIVLRTRRYRLYGVCVDEQGQAIADARVSVTSLPSEGIGGFTLTPNRPEKTITQFFDALTVRSDARGAFSLTVPVDGGMSVEISAPGRQTVYPFGSMRAGAPETGDLGRITLTGAGAIAGRIAFAEGSGVKRSLKGMILDAVEAGELQKAGLFGPPEHSNGDVPSDEAGDYRLEHLPPGTYTVFLFMIDGEGATDTPTTVIAAENVAVRAGETTRLDLRAVVGRRLEVRAFDADTNRPVSGRPGVHIEGPSRPRSAGLSHDSALSDRGEWPFDVAPGHYRVFLTGPITKGSPELASAEVDVPTDHAPEPVRLKVTDHQLRLHGRVQDAQGKPVPLGGLSAVHLFITEPKERYPLGGSQSSDGTFEIIYPKGVVHARLAVDVPGYSLWFSPDFVLTDRPDPVLATLEPAATVAVSGRVVDQDGKLVAHANVIGNMILGDDLTYQERLGSGVPGNELFTDQEGRFETRRFRGRDKFRLFVFDKGVEVSASAPWVQLGPGNSGRIEIDMYAQPVTRPPAVDVPIGPRDLAGHVVDALGQPVDGAKVTANTDPSAGAATTNAAGGFRFPDFGDRHYLYLKVEKAGFATHWETDLTVGHDFTIHLDNSTHLRGQFVKPDGSATSQAKIVLRTSRPTHRPFMGNPISNLRLDRQTDEHGVYDFPLEAGDYEVEITAEDGSLVARHGSVQVTAGQTGTLPAKLDAGLSLRVQTLDRVTGQPAAGVRFHIEDSADAAAMGIKPGSQKQTDAQGFVQWDHLFSGTVELLTSENDVYQRIWSRDDRKTYPENFPQNRPPQGNEGCLGQLFLKLAPDRTSEPVVMQVEHAVTISGEVLDAGGKPAINVDIRAIVDRSHQKGEDGKPSGDLVPYYAYEQDGKFSAHLPAGNGLPTRMNARPSDDEQGGALSEPFDSQPGDERHVTIHLTQGGQIAGRVVDGQGQALPNVSVAATPLDGLDSFAFTPWAKTDGQGHFRFEHVRPAEYEVTTTTVPHLSVGAEPPQEKRRVTVAAGGHVTMDDLHFIPTGWTGDSAGRNLSQTGPETVAKQPIGLRDLAGHVVDAQGEPMAGAKVTVLGAYPEVTPSPTDATGAFRFPDFGNRRYVYLEVEKSGYGTRWEADLPTGRDFTVRLENTTRFRGRLYKPDSTPAGPATVMLFAADKRTKRPNLDVFPRLERHTDEHGGYDFPVEPGVYRVEITADNDNLVARQNKVEALAGQATELPRTLEPGLTLRVQTMDSVTGRPAPGARFYAREYSPGEIGPRIGSERRTDAQGFAQWDHLFPGPMFLDVNQDPTYGRFWSTDEREHGHENALKSPHPIGNQADDGSLFIDVVPGRGDDPVIVQTERGVKVSGHVLDPQGNALGGVPLHVIMSYPGDKPGEETVYGLTGFPNGNVSAADGSFHDWCIPASNGGLTRLVAEDSESQTFGNGHSDPFPSVPGDEHEVTVRLTTGGWIEGRIVDAQGRPLANTPVVAAVLDHLDGYANHLGPNTDAQGHFRIGPLRPAEYEVRARGANFDWNHPEPPEERRRVLVRADETAQTDPLHFDPAGWTAPSTPSPSNTSSSIPPQPTESVASVVPVPSPAPAAVMLTAFVKVVDEDGKPIAGVKITPELLRIRAVPDSVYEWRDDRYGPPVPSFTDAGGIAALRYPRYVDESWLTGAVIFQAERSGYCPAFVYDYYAVVDDPARAKPVVLRRGATLRLRGHLPDSESTVPVYPQQVIPPGQTDKTQAPLSPGAWNDVGDNTLATSELSTGPSCVRVAHAAATGTLYFSEAQLVSAESGKTYTLDLELKPGVRVEGHLDASVPRPVRAGRVVVHVSATGSDKRLAWLGWDSWRDVAADGTFVFGSLPPGNVELMAVCEGYTSTGSPDQAGSQLLQVPQRFEALAGQTIQADIKMQAEAVCTVAVRDAAGAPVSGAHVSFFPGAQLLPPGLSTSFCLPSFKQEEFVSRWRTGDRLPGDRFAGEFFQAISDERGIATVHNLPTERNTVFNVTADGYKSIPPTLRGKQWHVDLVAGAKTSAEVQLEKIGTPPLDKKKASAPTLESTPFQGVAPTVPSQTSPQMDVPSTNADTPPSVPASASVVAPPAAARTLVFRVVEGDTKKSVPDAELRILRDNPEGEQPARTNSEGVCVIPLSEMPRQYLSVRVKKPGFVPMRVDWHCTQPTFQLPAEYTMPLEPGTTIGGTVLNEEGQPVASATLLLILRGSSGGAAEEVFPDIWEERVTTDAQGKWTYGAAPSAFRHAGITVEHPDYVRQDYSGPDGPPSVESLRAGTATIRLRRGVRVEGTVTDVAGKAIANAAILPGTDRSGSNTKPEYHTDAEGRFVIPHALPGGEAVLTVVAEGYAPEVVETSFSSAMSPLRVTLPPGQTLHLRVVDAAGQPLAGVLAVTDTWRKRRTLDICLRSDAAGWIEWKSAPADAVEYDFLKEGFQAARDVPLTVAAQEQTVTLRQPLLVSGAVTDARTHEPVRELRVITGLATPEGWRSWARAVARPGHDGRYVQAFDEPAALSGRHLLRVEAAGYYSAVSRQIDDAEGHVALDFSLEPGGPATGRVLTPDGTPAAGAKIALSFSPGRPVAVQDGEVRHDADQVEATADGQGRFEFPTQEPPYLLVITHPAGCATLTAEEFAANPDAHLTAWGRVSATVSPSDLPASGRQLPYYLTARPPDDPRPASDQPMVYFDAKPKLEADGTMIVFDKVRAGDWWLGRYGQANRNALPVQVHPGETAHAALPRSRSVVGRLNTAAVRDSVDLTQCQFTLALKTPPLPVPTELAVDERQAWFKQWDKTDAGKAYRAALRSYMGEVEADGSFRCDGVPVGKEYELRIVLSKPGEDPFHPKSILYFSKGFLLPDGQGVYDLGTAEVKTP